MLFRSFAALGSLAALAVVPVAANAASAGNGVQAATSVTVFLRAHDSSALNRLARNHTMARRARIDAVREVVPSPADHAVAANALTARGFTVVDESTWSVSATAPANTVAHTFGSRPTLGSNPSAARRTAATGALPNLPADLSSVASAAFPTSGGPAPFHPLSTDLDGHDFRNAYTSPARTSAGTAPYSGSGSKLTIATLQLSGWNSGSLTTYAGLNGIPYNSSTLTQVPVGQRTVPTTADDDGDVEVALDQEAILSTDPYAHQRAYFAPNTDAGYAGVFSQVLDDVLRNGHAYQGGDSRIAALSVSWGSCEPSNTPGTIDGVLEPIMKSLVAAGVTIFAATGDDGIYDCLDANGNPVSQVAVDYPASSPEVVAVGGTSLSSTDGAANTGGNWAESAWSCSGFTACTSQTGGGSGGGVSSHFAEPTYQTDAVGTSATAKRMVPDIAADADPDTGFQIVLNGQAGVVGGTSLAAPVSAALLVDMLSAHGASRGIGDIHTELYGAPATDFRDIASGSNGPGSSHAATAGYDTVTGLGAPLWPALARLLVSPTTATAKLALPSLHRHGGARTVQLSWGGSWTTAASVAVKRVGGGTILTRSSTAPSGSATFRGSPGATYQLTVSQRNETDHASTSRTIVVPVDNTAVTFHGRWSRHNAGHAIGGNYRVSAKRAISAKVHLTGRRYAVVFRVGPAYGKAAILVNGHRVRTVQMHAKKAGFRSVAFWGSSAKPVAKRTVTIRPAGKKAVTLDAFYAYR